MCANRELRGEDLLCLQLHAEGGLARSRIVNLLDDRPVGVFAHPGLSPPL